MGALLQKTQREIWVRVRVCECARMWLFVVRFLKRMKVITTYMNTLPHTKAKWIDAKWRQRWRRRRRRHQLTSQLNDSSKNRRTHTLTRTYTGEYRKPDRLNWEHDEARKKWMNHATTTPHKNRVCVQMSILCAHVYISYYNKLRARVCVFMSICE